MQCRAVLHQTRHVGGDALHDFIAYRTLVSRNRWHFADGFRVLDEEINLVDVNERVSQRARHTRIHLRDDDASALRGGFHKYRR